MRADASPCVVMSHITSAFQDLTVFFLSCCCTGSVQDSLMPVVFRLWFPWKEHYWVPAFPDSCDSFIICLMGTWLLQPGSDDILWTPRSQRSLWFFLPNLPGSRNFIELIDFYQEWVNDVLWKLLCIFMWLQESETAPSPPPTFAYLKAEFFRLSISNHNRCLASETALRHQIERSWGYRLDADIVG